ncbi:restriction endonuclease subunit S [Streptococcus alactolyticus]|uniref:Restriction endonuclease subunit S n=1 Tax=Streptococcus alactolyticus TaxID=29389 RepID=A0ABY7LWJ1_STRAY|nr:restriction endonuclease subunit S [Streptococcus alactolyticus]WBB05949.1 restriction endonuclease subunit S [Streptococcus alactolyticus]
MNYKEFRVKEVFEVENSRPLHKVNLLPSEGEGIPYITRTKFSNGFEETIVNVQGGFKNPKNTITFGAESVQFFYQPFEYFTGNKMYYLTRKDGEEITENQGLYLTTIIQSSLKNTGYGYGMGLTGTRFKERKIMLPIDDTGHPNWTFMEEYVQIKSNQIKDTYQLPKQHEITDFRNLDEVEWGEYFLTDIFTTVQRGKRLKKSDHIGGNTPYISSSKMNNGCDAFLGNKKNIRKFENCLTIANSGSVGSVFYHNYSFIASDHVTALVNPKFTKRQYLFIAGRMKNIGEKYSFNREISDTRIQREKVKLPITTTGQPDFDFMEQYMKRMENKVIQKTEMN